MSKYVFYFVNIFIKEKFYGKGKDKEQVSSWNN